MREDQSIDSRKELYTRQNEYDARVGHAHDDEDICAALLPEVQTVAECKCANCEDATGNDFENHGTFLPLTRWLNGSRRHIKKRLEIRGQRSESLPDMSTRLL